MSGRQQGFTLIEILVAIAVLAVGVLAAVSLQTSSLQNSRTAQLRERAVVLARNELDYQRAKTQTGNATNVTATNSKPPCASVSSGVYTCSVTITPCDWVSASASLSCAATTTAAVADQITVKVEWNLTKLPFPDTLSLKTVVARPGSL